MGKIIPQKTLKPLNLEGFNENYPKKNNRYQACKWAGGCADKRRQSTPAINQFHSA